MNFIRNKYIPFLIKSMIKKDKPTTEKDFVEFGLAVYDQIKKKERELDGAFIKN